MLGTQPERAARKILTRALDRELDGHQDQLASICLSLLLNTKTREVGRGMVVAFLNPGRTKKVNNLRSISFPIESLALVAESQFPAKRAELLWSAIPDDKKRPLMTKLWCYGIMNNNDEWAVMAKQAIEAREGQAGFDVRALWHGSHAVIKELMPVYGETVPDDVLDSIAWKMSLPQLLQQSIALYDDEALPHYEWLMRCLEGRISSLPEEMKAKFHGVDPTLYPRLAQAVADDRRKTLWKIGAMSGNRAKMERKKI